MKYHEFPTNPEGAFEPYAPGRMRLHGGGGGGGSAKNYKNLEKLYGEQAESARLLREQAEKHLPGAVENYAGQVERITSPEYATEQAGMAAADMASANAMEREATNRELASMGVNPNDARFAGAMRSAETNNAARMAAGQNMARNDAKRLQLAVAQDAVGTFTGQSNNAASQAGSATAGLANLYTNKAQQKQNEQAMQNQNISNAVSGGMAAWSMYKDGGKVRGRGFGALVKRPVAHELEQHMLGGAAGQQGGMLSVQPPAPVQMQPVKTQPQGPNMGQVVQATKTARGKGSGTFGERMAAKGAEQTDKFGRLAADLGAKDAGNQISSHASGMRMAGDPEQAKAAADAYRAAASETKDAALAKTYEASAANIETGAGVQAGGAAAETTAATAAAEQGLAATAPGVSAEVGAMASGAGAAGGGAGATAAAATEAAGLAATAPGVSSAVGSAASGLGAAGSTAASTGLGAAMGAIGTAMPWIGAAYAVGSLLGAWKDGGEIGGEDDFARAFASDSPAQDLRDGAAVTGPGSHTDDIVPALLSNGEGVLNGEAMALGGDEIMEELNAEGLKLREQGVSPDEIRRRGYGLSQLKKKEAA